MLRGTGRDRGYAGVRRAPEHLTFTFTHVMDPEQEDYSPECECRTPYRCTCDSYENLKNLYYARGSNDPWKKEEMPTDGINKRQDKGKSNLLVCTRDPRGRGWGVGGRAGGPPACPKPPKTGGSPPSLTRCHSNSNVGLLLFRPPGPEPNVNSVLARHVSRDYPESLLRPVEPPHMTGGEPARGPQEGLGTRVLRSNAVTAQPLSPNAQDMCPSRQSRAPTAGVR